MLDKNLTVSSRKLDDLLISARAVIKSYSEGTLVEAWDSNRIAALMKAIKSLEKSTGLGHPYFEVRMTDCLEWMEKEFWSDASLNMERDSEIDLNFQRIKRFSPDVLATLVPDDHHTMSFDFFEYGNTGRVAYWCENDNAVYPSLSKISKIELLQILQSFT